MVLSTLLNQLGLKGRKQGFHLGQVLKAVLEKRKFRSVEKSNHIPR